MAPQELIAALLRMNEEQGRQLLQKNLPTIDDDSLNLLVRLMKREADRQWAKESGRSFVLAGYLMFIGDMIPNKYVHALGLMVRGDALRRMDRDQEALPFLDAAGDEFLAVGDEVSWARSRIGRISACLQLNRIGEALRDAAAAREVFVRYGKLMRAGQVDVSAAIINYEAGHYEQALRLFDRAIEIYTRQGGGVELYIARAKANKAVALAAMGRFREAVALHEQARATFAHYQGQEISVARQELNIAWINAAQGHFSHALLLFNNSRTIFQRHDMQFQASEVAQQTCQCLLRLNRVKEAYELAGETIRYFRQSPGHLHNLAHSLMYQAEAAMLEGDFHDADEKLQEASTILEEIGFSSLASVVRLHQAELYFADGNLEDSLREARHAADAFAERKALPQLAQAALLQARIAANLGDTTSAEYLCHQALDIAQGQDILDLAYRCDYLLGQIAEYHDNLEGATKYYDRAMMGIDIVQSHLVMDERSSFLEDKGSIYKRAVILALKQGSIEKALVYVEKAKSRVLGDYLRNNIDIRMRAGDKAGEAILEDLSRLREEQAWFSNIVYEAEFESGLSDTALMRIQSMAPGQARQEMQKRERSIEHLLEQLQLRLAGDLVSRSRPQWTDSIIMQLWPKIEHTVLMLEYYLTEQDLYIFEITRDGVDVHVEKDVVSKLERLFSLWRTNLNLAAQASGARDRVQAFSGLQENCLGLLQRLYDVLLRPVSSALEHCEHVTIVPYGMLHYLPFHCLFDGVQFVVERLDVSYLPSAALMEICYQRGLRTGVERIPLKKSLIMGMSDGGRLAFAVQEAKAVAQELGASCILDQDATTALLQEAGATSPIVHIAAHGLFRLDAPNFSHIKLADRQLSAIEVFNLDLSSCTLVTLSACETGRGIVGGVDEVIGLGRGFLYAGAASLMTTLWKVDDASSAELMEMYYKALLSEYGKAAALAGAQRAFLAHARTSVVPYRVHPYFWGGFHLIGDPGPI
jgi:CHAT domain-containing protein